MIIARMQNEITAREAMRAHGAWVAGTMVMVGVQLFLPTNTFGSGPQFKGMAEWFAEKTWAWFFISLGASRIISIIHGHHHDLNIRSIAASCILSGASGILWLGVTILFFMSNPAGLFFIVTAGYAGVDLTTSTKLARIGRSTYRRLHGR